MTTLTIASDSADAEAMDAVENHHAQMSGELTLLVTNLVDAADGGNATSARDRLVAWARESLVPHALAEEKTLYPAAREQTEGRLLADAMLAEQEDRLRGWLARNGDKSDAEPEYAFYNSPVVPGPLRRNEVWLGLS